MESFSKALQDSELFDMGYKGPKFTWSNNMEGLDFTKKKRLDRVVANP